MNQSSHTATRGARVLSALIAIMPAPHVTAGVSYTFDKLAWQAAAGGVQGITQINFNDFAHPPYPNHILISDQWKGQGITFTDGDDWMADAIMSPYPGNVKRAILGKDVWNSPPPLDYDINIEFATPIRFWGARPLMYAVQVYCYSGEDLVGEMLTRPVPFEDSIQGDVFPIFVGFESSTSFDRIRIARPPNPPPGLDLGAAAIVDYMSFAVPTPGALGLLIPTLLGVTRRRRAI